MNKPPSLTLISKKKFAFYLWIAANICTAKGGIDERGYDRTLNNCKDAHVRIVDYVMPGFLFGCWIGKKA